MNIVPELNLNRHPKDCKCNSLIVANNIRLSNDNSCLQSEESIKLNEKVYNYLTDKYTENVRIEGVIPCNKELVLFCVYNDRCDIVRYNEIYEQFKIYYTLVYEGGAFKGDFMYNSINELIIAFCEINANETGALKTANLGKFEDNVDLIFADNLVLNPSPNFSGFDTLSYINGIAKKGWYNFFIRYKIDKVNYTQWYPLGYPIYINSVEERAICKLYNSFINKKETTLKYIIGIGFTDYISTDDDISKITARFSYYVADDKYPYHQIGWTCSNKTSIKGYKTEDIKTLDQLYFELSYENVNEYDVSNFLISRSNYYNVNNINAYKNRLYIADYKEHYKDKSYFDNYVKKLSLSAIINTVDISEAYCIDKDRYNLMKNDSDEIVTNTESLISYIDCSKNIKARLKKRTLIPDNLYKFYIHFVDLYGEATDGIEIPFSNNVSGFEKVIINDREYFKLSCPNYLETENKNVYRFILTVGLTDEIDFPEGYITTFLSYEKMEQNQITGILCNYDFNDDKSGYLKSDASCYHFYSNDLDIKDKINLNFNKIRIDAIDIYDTLSSHSISKNEIALIKFAGKRKTGDIKEPIHNLNVAEAVKGSYEEITYIDLLSNELSFKFGGDGKVGRDGVGTCIEITTSKFNDLFSNIYSVHKVTLIGVPIISTDVKELIKFTNYFRPKVTKVDIDGAYDGFITFNSAYIYNANKVILDDVNNEPYDTDGIYYIPAAKDPTKSLVDLVEYDLRKPFVNIQYWQYGETMFETKCFKEEPISVICVCDESDTNTDTTRAATKIGYFVKPINSIDLYKDNYGKLIDNTYKLYYPYSKYTEDFSTFIKTIRRSAVIADESLENSWRNFPAENYKVINESKGKITNLIGLGDTLLVHTEHSLFMFNMDFRLTNTNDDIVNASKQDVFDVDYQEVFTSKLGVCGLQDGEAYVVDDFGYIFYDNDAHKIYKFSSKAIEEIDYSIINWLNKYKPYQIRFANDKESNRIIMACKCRNIGQLIVMDYNLVMKSFISFHNYCFDYTIRTKNILYYVWENKLYNINYNTNPADYNTFENSYDTNPNTNSISIIFNNDYDVIKALEFISYRLYMSNDNYEYNNNGMIANKEPYSGNTLQVANNLVDSGVLDVSVSSEDIKNILENYKKPYWNLGNWNFNYLRDIKNGTTADTMSRLYGNYFVLTFIFGGTNVKYEIESLECGITKFR